MGATSNIQPKRPSHATLSSSVTPVVGIYPPGPFYVHPIPPESPGPRSLKCGICIHFLPISPSSLDRVLSDLDTRTYWSRIAI